MSSTVTVVLLFFLSGDFAFHPATPAPTPRPPTPPPTTTTTATATTTTSQPLTTPSSLSTTTTNDRSSSSSSPLAARSARSASGSTVGTCPDNYSPINTSLAWMNSAGAWAHPCIPPSDGALAGGAGAVIGRRWVQSPSLPRAAAAAVSRGIDVTHLADDAEAMCREAADLADTLRINIVDINMLRSWSQARTFDGHPLLPGPRNFNTSQFTDKLQFASALRRQVSVALVYLEQNRYNDVPLCVRGSNVVQDYDRLIVALLRVLCKTYAVVLALARNDSDSTDEAVLRSVMPANHRTITDVVHGETVIPGDFVRDYRDYATASDVKTIMLSAAAKFRDIDWS